MKKDKSGKIVLKENFFLKYFWGFNLFRFLTNKAIILFGDKKKGEPKYPSNLCSLFWGAILAPLAWILSLVVYSLQWVAIGFIVIIGILVVLFGFLAGFMPIFSEKKYHIKNKDKIFHPYKRYGYKDEKRLPVAPWKILLPILFIWMMARNGFALPQGIVVFFCSLPGGIVMFFYSLFQLPIFWIIIGSIIVLVLVILFFRSTAWKITREFLKAKKQKLCPLITIEKKK